MAFAWPQNAHAAVSFAFDGAGGAHVSLRDDLKALGMAATFYCDAPGLLEDVAGWTAAVKHGHEIGNHALLGACDLDGLLARMSFDAISEEVDDFCALLRNTFGVKQHSAAMPLVKTWPDEAGLPAVPEVIHRTIVRLNDDALYPVLDTRYDTIRSPNGRFNAPEDDRKSLRTCRIDGLDAVSVGLIAQVAISQQAWVILSARHAEPATILQIANWLKRQDVWVAPVIQVAKHLQESFPVARTFHSV